jgi:hypothetical protein
MRKIIIPISVVILSVVGAGCGGSNSTEPASSSVTDSTEVDVTDTPMNSEPSTATEVPESNAPAGGNGEFVIDAFEKSFSANEVQCSDIDGTTYVYGIASANSTATLSWEGTSRANAYVAWGLTGDDGYIPFPETFVVNVAEDGLSGTFTGDFMLPDVTNINRRPFSGTFECGT